MCARLRLFTSHWTNITLDPWVLKQLARVIKLNLYPHPRNTSLGSNGIILLLLKGRPSVRKSSFVSAIRKCSFDETQFVSNLSLVPKTSGEMRPVINLKCLNSFLEYFHFKMENINSLIDFLWPNDFITTIDLKDAYFTVPMQ